MPHFIAPNFVDGISTFAGRRFWYGTFKPVPLQTLHLPLLKPV